MKIGFVRALPGVGKAGWRLPWREADMIRTHCLAHAGNSLARTMKPSLLILAVFLLLPVRGFSQTNADLPKAFPANRRIFSIPFSLPARDVRMVRLYISTNQGANWDVYSTASPSDRGFNVRVDH